MTVVNALTIDVQDYFQIHAFSDVICTEDWDSCEPRIERNTYRLLALLDSVEGQRSASGPVGPTARREDRGQKTAYCTQNGHEKKDKPQKDPESRIHNPESSRTRATFFVLGWVAERYPSLVKEIQARGHEVACHGYAHQCVFNQGQEEFREDVRKAKEIIEDIIGNQVIGYRAPTCSITRETLWALPILYELGFLYDSSIFPIKHDFYGFPDAPRFPFYIDFSDGDILSQLKNPKYLHELKEDRTTHNEEALSSMPHVHPVKFAKGDHFTGAPCPMPDALHPTPASGLFEFPLSTIRLFGHNLPCSGGGYFRLFPYWYTRRGFKRLNSNGAQPVVFYIHPWELDPDIPIVDRASRRSKFRTYVNINRTESRFKRLLQEFHFAPLASLLKTHG
jgi:polysaccharide deacetylase family protein (PEP-CTERM system associated)